MKRGPNVPRTCAQCGAAFRTWPYVIRDGGGIFCSKSCEGRHRRTVVGRKLIEDNSIPEPNSGCWLWTGTWNYQDYGIVDVAGKRRLAHRLSHLVFRGSLLDDEDVLHLCDNTCCVNPEHLKAGTQADNVQDAVRKGRHAHGSGVWSAILSETQIPEIRRKLALGQKKSTIAAEYGVHPNTISVLARGLTWKSV